MTTRNLAQFTVSSVGMGCMGFSHGYGALPTEVAFTQSQELAMHADVMLVLGTSLTVFLAADHSSAVARCSS